MEKLQNAIEKARQKRAAEVKAEPPRTLRHATPKDQEAQDNAPQGDWGTLTPLTLDHRVLNRNRIVTMSAGPAATSFDILRTKILLQMRENGWKRLAITSPQPACGKTTVACNIALGMTRQPDLRAILFDLDLRRPRIASALGHKPKHDLSNVLDGRVAFQDQALRVGNNLAISMMSRTLSDPTSLLLDQATETRLDHIQETYQPDLMIFDMPPLLTGDDTRAFLKNVDCALLVLRAEDTKSSQIDISEREINQYTNVIGMTLNACRFPDETQNYGYY